jgi:hypothetical protein
MQPNLEAAGSPLDAVIRRLRSAIAPSPNGDTTTGSVTIIRVEHGKPVPLRVISRPAGARPPSG